MTGPGETAELPLTAGQLQHFAVTRRNPALRMAIWSCFRLPGELDVDRLNESVETLVSRHEALRIEILERPGGEPRQRIRDLPPRAGLVCCQNVLARSEEQFSRYVRHILVQEVRREWDTDAYPFKFRLFRYSPAVHTLMAGFSHMAVDGIGADLLIHDLLRTYADAMAGRAPRGRPRRGFTDSLAGRSAATGEAPRRRTGRARSDPPPSTRFDVPPPDPAEPGGQSRQSSLSLSGTRLAALREQADLHGCTEFTWILAAFARTVLRFTRQDRISISVPVDMRGPAEREVVGMYVLEVPVVIERPRDADDGPGFVAGVGSAVLRAMVRHRRSRTWGEESGTDLSVNYRKMSALDGRAAGLLGGARYRPRIDYLTPGMSLLAVSRPDALDVQLVLDSGVFSEDAAKAVAEALGADLAPGSSR